MEYWHNPTHRSSCFLYENNTQHISYTKTKYPTGRVCYEFNSCKVATHFLYRYIYSVSPTLSNIFCHISYTVWDPPPVTLLSHYAYGDVGQSNLYLDRYVSSGQACNRKKSIVHIEAWEDTLSFRSGDVSSFLYKTCTGKKDLTEL